MRKKKCVNRSAHSLYVLVCELYLTFCVVGRVVAFCPGDPLVSVTYEMSYLLCMDCKKIFFIPSITVFHLIHFRLRPLSIMNVGIKDRSTEEIGFTLCCLN